MHQKGLRKNLSHSVLKRCFKICLGTQQHALKYQCQCLICWPRIQSETTRIWNAAHWTVTKILKASIFL